MRSAETVLGIIHDRGSREERSDDTGEPGAPKAHARFGEGRMEVLASATRSRLLHVRHITWRWIPFAERRGSEEMTLGQRLTWRRKPKGTGACRRSGSGPKTLTARSRKTRAIR